MHPILLGIIVATGVLGTYGLLYLARFIYWEVTSPLSHLPGPPSGSWIYGNSRQIQASKDMSSTCQEKWIEQYGSAITYKWFFERRLYTIDSKAISHVLMSGYDYQKPELIRLILDRLVGPGLLMQENDHHKLQRKVMNPAFGVAQIHELTEIFVEESLHLRDIWLSQVGANDKQAARIDVLSYLSRMTLEVIVQVLGFNYQFNALSSEEPDELNKAFSTIFGTANTFTLWTVLRTYIPILRIFPTINDTKMKEAQTTMKRIGWDLLCETKKHLMATGEKGNWCARDLLSLMVRSNTSKDIAENQRMSDEDVIAQVPTFLVAGHETSSTAVTWALFALVKNKEIQHKLREELLEVPTESPTLDILNSLPYLDAVVRETLRIHPPVIRTQRIATKDDILPLNTPFTDKNGEVHNGISIRKGETIFIPILAMNRAKAFWGEDAKEFKPERWLIPGGVPSAASSIPGVWGNMLSFLGGVHSCIGYRFSLAEMKALLFVLVRAFEFDLPVPQEEVVSKVSVVQRPYLKSEIKKGSQLPLLVKPYVGS